MNFPNPKAIDRKSEVISALSSTGQVLGIGALTALAAKVSFFLPFSPVPITLQSFVVLLAGVILGSKKGALSQVSLIGMGLTGLPVFAEPLPGFAVMAGPTGGYILGFVFAAYVAGRISEDLKPKNLLSQFFYLFLASLFIFLPGVIWLSVYTGADLGKALQLGFFPFLAGDIMKCFAVAGFSKLLSSFRSN